MAWWKLVLTMAGLLLVMGAARLGGRRMAGVLAAWPTVTAPTLAWTALDQGTGFAVEAAVGSVASCAALAAFALAYAHAARRLGAGGALGCGAVAVALAALPAQEVSHALPAALALALTFTLLAWATLPTRCARAVGGLQASQPSWLAAGLAGGLTLLVTTLGPALGPFATGMLASLPLVSGPMAMAEHARAGHHAATEFLRGYVRGLFGKAAFGTLFALMAPRTGLLPALAVALALTGALELRPRRRVAAARPLNSRPR